MQSPILIEKGKDYVISSKAILGVGNCGAVEEVEDLNTGKIYARKTMLLPTGRRKAERRQMFDNEAKIIRGLVKHPHIIRVFATYYDDPKVCLILQPVADSGDLGRFLEVVRDEMEECNLDSGRQPDQIKISTLRRAFGCLASGLTSMHEQHIRHKDIKCKNILVHNGDVIYTDFGISTDFSHSDGSTTEGPVQFLTRRFSSPEVLDHAPRNSSSDVYSLGCVYFDILSTLTGFSMDPETSCSDHMEHLQDHVENSKSDGMPKTLVQIVTSMIHTERKRRPTSSQVWTKFQSQKGYACAKCVLQHAEENEQSTLGAIPPCDPRGSYVEDDEQFTAVLSEKDEKPV
jgi:serine/threonine protein kinase